MNTEQPSTSAGQRTEFMICDVCNEVAPKAEGILVSPERFRQVQYIPNSKLIPAVVARMGRSHEALFSLPSFASVRAFSDDKEAA